MRRSSRALWRVAAIIAAVTCLYPSPVGAQPIPEGEGTEPSTSAIQLESVTPWVTESGTFRAVFDADGFPEGAKLTYRIRQPVSGTESDRREQLIDLWNGTARTNVLHANTTVDVADLIQGDRVLLDIPIRARSTRRSGAVLIPGPGTYAVDVTIRSGSSVIYETQLSLNALPAPERQSTPFQLAVVANLSGPIGSDESGTIDDTAAVERTLQRYRDLIEDAAGAPIAVSISPQLLVTAPSDAQPPRLMDALTRASTVERPWADLDLEAWAKIDAAQLVRTSLLDGAQALSALGVSATQRTMWFDGATVGTQALPLLARLGYRIVSLDDGRITGFTAPTGESGYTRPVQLASSPPMSALVTDPVVADLLSGDLRDSVLAAHRLLTLFSTAHLAGQEPRGASIVVGDDVDPDVVAALYRDVAEGTDALEHPIDASADTNSTTTTTRQPTGDPPIRAAVELVLPDQLNTLSPLTSTDQGQPTVTPVDSPSVASVASVVPEARALIDDYATIIGSGTDDARRISNVVQRSLDRRIEPSVQAGMLNDVIDEMNQALGAITVSKPRALNVTERNTTIPLRVVNDLDRPINVRLRLKSSRMNFVDGDVQALSLEPGVNPIPIRVEVLTSGQFTMEAEVLAPESTRVIASTRQHIRSTAFSGVGLVLSGGALIFLVVWWLRTPHRKRPADQPDER